MITHQLPVRFPLIRRPVTCIIGRPFQLICAPDLKKSGTVTIERTNICPRPDPETADFSQHIHIEGEMMRKVEIRIIINRMQYAWICCSSIPYLREVPSVGIGGIIPCQYCGGEFGFIDLSLKFWHGIFTKGS